MEKYTSQYQRRKTEIDAFISLRNKATGAILNAERLNETGSEIVNSTIALPVLDFSDFEEEGFEKTEELDKAIFIFNDGTLYSGFSEGGGPARDIDHGSIAYFVKDTSMDRYHPDFWSTVLHDVVKVVPETNSILFLENYEYSLEQQLKMNEYELNGYELIPLESTIQKENSIRQEKGLKDYEGAQAAYISYLVGAALEPNQQATINRFDLLNDPVVSVEMRVDALEKLDMEFDFPVERNIEELERMISDDARIKEFVANEHDEMKKVPEKEYIEDYALFDNALSVYKKYLLEEAATYEERSELVKFDEKSTTYDQVSLRLEAMLQVQNETGADFSEEIKQFESTRAESFLEVSALTEKEYFQLSKNEKVAELKNEELQSDINQTEILLDEKEAEKSALITYDEAFAIYVKYVIEEPSTLEERVNFSKFDKESNESERIAIRLEAMKLVQNYYVEDISWEIEQLERVRGLTLEVEKSEYIDEEALEEIHWLLELSSLAEEDYFELSKNEQLSLQVENNQVISKESKEISQDNLYQNSTEEFVLLDKANQVGELSLKFAKENKLTPEELDRLRDMDQDVGYDRAIHARLTAVEAELFTLEQAEGAKQNFGIVESENEESKREKLETKLETLKDNLNEISKGEESEKESYLNKEYTLVFDEHFLTRSDTFELTEAAATNYLKFIVEGEITPDETKVIMDNDKEIGSEASFVSRFELLTNLPRVYQCEETDRALQELEEVKNKPEIWDVVIENEHDSMVGTYEYNQQMLEGRTLEEAEKIDGHEPLIEYGQ